MSHSEIYLPNHLTKFFTEARAVDENNAEARCQSCQRFFKFSKKATSNLITHLKRCDKQGPVKYLQQIEIRDGFGTHQLADSIYHAAELQMLDFGFLQKRLTKTLVKSMACDQLPLSIVESPTFRELLLSCEPRFNIPSKTDLQNKILPRITEKLEEAIRMETADLTSVNLTVDLWTDRSLSSFMAVTQRFIDSSFELKSRLLACESSSGHHAAVSIAAAFEEIVGRYSLDGKVQNVVSDNTASIIKARNFGLPNFQLVETAFVSHKTKRCSIDEELRFSMNDDAATTIFSHLPQRASCFVHTLQLVVNEGLKAAGESNECVVGVLKKTANLVNSIRTTAAVGEWIGKHGGATVVDSNEAKWVYHLGILQFVSKRPETINIALSLIPDNKETLLSKFDLSVIFELVKVLEPFAEALSQVEHQEAMVVSFACPVIKGIRKELKEMLSNNALQHCNFLASEFLERIEKMLERSFYKNDNYRLASILDPRFKLDWIEDTTEKERMLWLLKGKVKDKYVAREVAARDGSKTASQNALLPYKKPRIFSFLQPATSETRLEALLEDIVQKDIEPYFIQCRENTSDALSFWKNRECSSLFKDVVREILSLTITSTTSKKLCSIAEELFHSKRNNIENSAIQSLILTKCNAEVYATL